MTPLQKLTFRQKEQFMKSIFEILFENYNWREIHGCPGRYTCGDISNIEPLILVGNKYHLKKLKSSVCSDTVIICDFKQGGLISYEKEDGTFIHTLNTEYGFIRKLKMLKIDRSNLL